MCPVCGKVVKLRGNIGNIRVYCSAKCRHSAYRSRKKGLELKLGNNLPNGFSKKLPALVPYPTTAEIRQNRIRDDARDSSIRVVQRRYKSKI